MFNRWRIWIAKQAGLPLHLMEGFYEWEWDESDRERISQKFTELYVMAGDCTSWVDTLKPMQELGGPIKWDLIGEHPLRVLLSHSDCEGRIRWWHCKGIAIELGRILRRADNDTRPVTQQGGVNDGKPLWSHWKGGRGTYDGNVPATKRFIRGCLEAYKKREDIIFR
jgi:hypothetical protein